MATPRQLSRDRYSRPFSTTVALDDLSEEESIPFTASAGVRRSASRGYLRPKVDEYGMAVATDAQRVRRVFGRPADAGDAAPPREMPQARNLRGLGIDTANAAASCKLLEQWTVIAELTRSDLQRDGVQLRRSSLRRRRRSPCSECAHPALVMHLAGRLQRSTALALLHRPQPP